MRISIIIATILVAIIGWGGVMVSGATAHTITDHFLASIRRCESGGDYTATNFNRTETHFDNRIGSYGAYQFGQGTWDWVARTLGWEVLIGKRPDYMPFWVQDAMARQLALLEYHDDTPGVGNYSWWHWGNC